MENKRDDVKYSKKCKDYLIGGFVGGATFIVIPAILLIIGSIFGSIS